MIELPNDRLGGPDKLWPPPPEDHAQRRCVGVLALTAAGLLLGFAKPLYELVRFAAKSELYSHVLLIPFISLYLVWIRRSALPAASGFPCSSLNFKRAWLPLCGGLGLLGSYWLALGAGWHPSRNDVMALMVGSFVLLLMGSCLLILDRATLRAVAFPLALLAFLVPFPTFLEHGLEVFFQRSSAVAADLLLNLSGATVLRRGVDFQLPGISLTVAEECSGIHSSLVLFITSLLAGHFFLRTFWKKTLLTFAVIPLAILRNGFRIFTIAQLCVHISPDMINSWIHRRGGPFFFALSLIPFFGLLLWLRKSELANLKS